MAYNFLGSIKSFEDFQEFEEFVQIEITVIQSRIDHLLKEQNRFYELLDKFKHADLNLRSRYSLSEQPDIDWINSPRPAQAQTVTTIDSLNSMEISPLKDAFNGTIKFRRERTEFKVKKIRDLIEQLGNEATSLTTIQNTYQDKLDRVSSRFSSVSGNDFPEAQQSYQDSARTVQGINAVSDTLGITVVNGITQYSVLSINAATNTITFENAAPPVSPGDIITLSGGSNLGPYTVKSIVNFMTLETVQSLTTEVNSTTSVVI